MYVYIYIYIYVYTHIKASFTIIMIILVFLDLNTDVCERARHVNSSTCLLSMLLQVSGLADVIAPHAGSTNKSHSFAQNGGLFGECHESVMHYIDCVSRTPNLPTNIIPTKSA